MRMLHQIFPPRNTSGSATSLFLRCSHIMFRDQFEVVCQVGLSPLADARTQATLERIIEGERGEGKRTKVRKKAKNTETRSETDR